MRGILLGVLLSLMLLPGMGQGRAQDHSSKEEPARESAREKEAKKENPEESKDKKEEGTPERPRLFATFDDGVLLSNAEEDFQLRLHVMEQTDFKLFLPTFQRPARPGIYIPRFRTYFEGRATRSFEYELSLQRSVEGAFDVLDANINFRPCEEFQVKVGRFLVPYSYDWYDHLEQYFLTPERGLFPLNFGLSREAGAMIWGRLWDHRVDYALGGFDGQLAGLADTNTTRDGVGYLNLRPFLRGDRPRLRFLNVGGSLAVGTQAYPAAPLPLRTAIQSSENDEAAQGASAIFFDFNEDVVALGARYQGALHLAWYVGQLSLEAEAQAGSFRYTRPGLPEAQPVRVAGFHVGAGYFLTGEEIEKRTVVEPLRPFDPANGQWGPGAIELFTRYSQLQLGNEVFTAELADPDRWTRSAYMTDVGVNWYPNRYVKVYFDWQHTQFGSPVALEETRDRFRRATDLFWLRCQFYY